MAASTSTSAQQLELIQKIYHEALVEAGKAIRAAAREGNLTSIQESVITNPRIPACTASFNSALDKLELEIIKAREVLGRDLNKIRASRQPPPPRPELVAPAAMMAVDLESPNTAMDSLPSNPPPGPTPTFQNPPRPVKQENKPVAPFPNMGGFDLSVSPVVSHTPSPKTVVKGALPKKSPRPAPVAGAVGKALNAPPRKETKVPLPPTARSMSTSSTPGQPRAAPAPAPARSAPLQSVTPIPIPVPPTQVPPLAKAPAAPVQTPVPIPTHGLPATPLPVQTPAPVASMAPTGSENIFTDMTFSLAPPMAEAQNGNSAQLGEIDLTALGNGDLGSLGMNGFPGAGGGGGGGNGAPDANMDLGGLENHDTVMASEDAKLFDMGPNLMDNMDVDYDLGGDNGDNSNFNDMYFNDDNMTSGEFDATYFGM
ncbi:hypothetical protein QBC39DRAFT_166587 [Podospora conica]|nr:hypothetical protein QBC39DRAFT_166587 [Schizothecium conicum]